MTMLVVTHEMGFAKEVADRVVVMADGEIIEQAAPEELFENPRDTRTLALIERYRSGTN
jgi:ABC-type polar amino acid transport system ATPase subunit